MSGKHYTTKLYDQLQTLWHYLNAHELPLKSTYHSGYIPLLVLLHQWSNGKQILTLISTIHLKERCPGSMMAEISSPCFLGQRKFLNFQYFNNSKRASLSTHWNEHWVKICASSFKLKRHGNKIWALRPFSRAFNVWGFAALWMKGEEGGIEELSVSSGDMCQACSQ